MTTATADNPIVRSLANWYGSNRSCGRRAAAECAGSRFIAVPFAGGMSELIHMNARTIDVNDKHKHLINMARVIADPVNGPKLYRLLRRIAYHVDALRRAQSNCKHRDAMDASLLFPSGDTPSALSDDESIAWALDYFVCCWMGRASSAGTKREFDASFSIRFDANGGDSATRFANAVRSLPKWRRVFRSCTFTDMDGFEFIERVSDDGKELRTIYCDVPFPGPGDKYSHPFTTRDQRHVAELLASFQNVRVVCRFYDHALIRDLYPEDRWNWTFPEGGKAQTNDGRPEVLLINGESYIS